MDRKGFKNRPGGHKPPFAKKGFRKKEQKDENENDVSKADLKAINQQKKEEKKEEAKKNKRELYESYKRYQQMFRDNKSNQEVLFAKVGEPRVGYMSKSVTFNKVTIREGQCVLVWETKAAGKFIAQSNDARKVQLTAECLNFH